MKTFYPNILTFVAAWALRLLFVLLGMALAVRLIAQDNCGITISSPFNNPTIDCSAPIPDFAAFEASNNCCPGPINLTYFQSEGNSFVENCIASTAFGPGPDWSLWLPNLPGGLSQYWHFIGAPTWQAFSDGTAHLQGTIAMQGNTNNQFAVDVWFQNGMGWNDWSALGRQYKDDLFLAETLHQDWMFYEMAPQFATLTGIAGLAGSQLHLTHQPSSYYYGFQSGIAANNRNANQGVSGWFYYNGTVAGQPANGHGDINVDTSCQGGEGCANTIHTLVVRAQDACGNVAFDEQTITVVDSTAPAIDPYEAVITMDCENYQGIYITATDNCSEVAITYTDQSEAPCTSVTRTYTIADACGNTTTATQIILLNAGEPPVFTVFPEALTVDCKDADEIPTPEVLWSVGCGGEELTITSEIIPGDCPNTYQIAYTYEVIDNCGGSAIAVWVVSVVDMFAPELYNVPADMEIDCGDEIPEVNVFAIDNCDNDVLTSLTATTEYGTCGYQFIRTWSATDDCGNTVTATQTIYVNDTEDPQFSFVPSSVMLPCGTPFELAIPTADDACSEVEMEWTDVDLEDCAGSYARIFRAFDGCGNSRLATVFVMFTDTEAPEMVDFPEDEFVSCGTIPATNDVEVTWQDNCGNVSVEVSEIVIPGDCDGAYTIARTWELTDDCGNTSSHTWNIFVGDQEAPTLLGVPQDITISCGDEISDATVVAEDDCASEILVTLEAETIQNECGYVFVRTWSAVDGCGNNAIGTQMITVEDNTPPVFTYVPNDLNLACTNGTVDTGEMATAEDECSTVEVTFFDSVLEGNCGEGILRTFVAVDGCGNVEVAEQIISFNDNFSPEFTAVPEDIFAVCGDEVTIPMPMVTDDCSEVVLTFEDTPISTCGGSFIRNYTATDACGNTEVAAVSVFFNDNQNPEITNGPEDIVVSCDAVPSIESAQLEYNDNCGSIEIQQLEERLDGDCPGEYTLVRTYTLTDECGNNAEWIWTIQVVDNTNPEIIGVPPATTIGCGDEVPVADVFATDNCDEFPMLDLSAETIFNECGYQFIRTWTATDHCGNTSTQSQIINVTDNVNPFFTFVPADVNFTCGEIGEMEMATADDDCSNVEIGFVDVVTNPTSGSFTRNWTATDGCGNTVTAQTNVTFQPNGPPAILCPANQTLVVMDNCTAVVPDFTSLAWLETDCVDPTTLTVTQEPIQGTFVSSNTEITLTVTNEANLSSSCSFLLQVIDETAPVLVCVDDQNIVLTPTCTAVIPDYTSLIDVTDACVGEVEVTQTPTAGTVINGTNVVIITITATDMSGNATECTFGVQPVDVTAPWFTIFPEDMSVQCDQIPGPETVDVQYTDGCGVVNVDYNEEIIALTTGCLSNYQIIRTWTITDEAGNSHSEDWTIDVVDDTDPILVGVPQDMTIQCGEAIPDVQVEATDNCDTEVSVSLEATTISLDCGYVFQRTWIAVDDCGNTATAEQNIIVEDNVDPFFTFVPDAAVIACEEFASVLPTLPMAIADDECSNVEVTFVDEMQEDCSGSFTRLWTATDGCGNTATAETYYTVEDLDAPVFTAVPGDLMVNGCAELPEATIDQITYTENCSNVTLTVADEEFELDCPNNKLIYRVWRLTDGCGNQSSYTQEIYVIDETAPVISGVPANQVLACGQAPEEANVFAVDNCSSPENITISLHAKTTQLACGNIFVRVWTATDECGNSTIATQEITYTDNSAPTFVFVPEEMVVNCGMEYELEVPLVTDDCSTFSVQTINGPPGCSGTFERTFIATDGCGNSSQATQLVIVEDNLPPVPNWLPSDIEVTDCNNVPLINASYVTFTDNCSEVQVDFDTQTQTLCPNSYITTYTWTATDGCENIETVSMNLTVLDETAPQIVPLPLDLVLNCGDEIPVSDALAVDDCGDAFIETEDEIISLECGYQILRTWYASDACGNVSSHIQSITFEDQLAPVFVDTPDDLVLECTEIIPLPQLVLGMDDCQGMIAAEMTNEAIVSGSCNSNYQILRTYTLTDDCGHTSNYVQTITIQDTQAPIFFEFDESLEVLCTQSNGVFATAYDDCSSISVSYDDDLIGSGCSGLIQRTYSATDACGNTQQAVQFITLLDNTNPYFVIFPDDITADCASIPAPESVTVTYGDNCSNPNVDMEETVEEGSCANEYLILRNYTLTDACGNQASQTWTITVQDTTAPEIFGVPVEANIECGDPVPAINPIAFDICDEAPTLSFTAVTVPTATGCGEMFIRTWQAVDACGNESTLSHTTYIVDTTAPQLSSTPANIFVPCSEILPTAPIITALDVCDGEVEVTFEETGAIGTCDNVIREWCATDCAGNQTCHQQTIFRTTSPTPITPALVAYNSDRHRLTIQLTASTEGRWNLDVFDLSGRKVSNLVAQDMKLGQSMSFELDCQGYTDTIYLMRWSNGEEQVTQKVVMMK